MNDEAWKEDGRRGTSALIRAGRGLAADEEDHDGSSESGRGFFVTAQDVLERLGRLEGQALALGAEIDVLSTARPTFKSSWKAWYDRFVESNSAIRKRGSVSLNLSASKIMDELSTDERHLAMWRAGLLGEGGQPSAPLLSTRQEPERRFGAMDLRSILKWAAIVTGIFGFGYLLRSFGEVTHAGSNFVTALKGGRKKEGEDAPAEASRQPAPRQLPTHPPSHVPMRLVGQRIPSLAPRAEDPAPRFGFGRQEATYGSMGASPIRRMLGFGQRQPAPQELGLERRAAMFDRDEPYRPALARRSPVAPPDLTPPDQEGWAMVLAPKSELGNMERSLEGRKWYVVDDDEGNGNGEGIR